MSNADVYQTPDNEWGWRGMGMVREGFAPGDFDGIRGDVKP